MIEGEDTMGVTQGRKMAFLGHYKTACVAAFSGVAAAVIAE